mmetsp:Transcript_6911/g.19611  ORF Transcript_6911/g.19611 Transcript_6911/m.19611 type:complete len:208 (+) Transcript_6911:517-1140(+)
MGPLLLDLRRLVHLHRRHRRPRRLGRRVDDRVLPHGDEDLRHDRRAHVLAHGSSALVLRRHARGTDGSLEPLRHVEHHGRELVVLGPRLPRVAGVALRGVLDREGHAVLLAPPEEVVEDDAPAEVDDGVDREHPPRGVLGHQVAGVLQQDVFSRAGEGRPRHPQDGRIVGARAVSAVHRVVVEAGAGPAAVQRPTAAALGSRGRPRG